MYPFISRRPRSCFESSVRVGPMALITHMFGCGFAQTSAVGITARMATHQQLMPNMTALFLTRPPWEHATFVPWTEPDLRVVTGVSASSRHGLACPTRKQAASREGKGSYYQNNSQKFSRPDMVAPSSRVDRAWLAEGWQGNPYQG
jgi:hypothetical protein